MDPRYNQYQQQMTSQYNQYHDQYQQHPLRASYPQVSCVQSMHSTFQSSISLSSYPSMSTSPSQTSMHSRQSPVLSSAPLPSPTAERQATGGNYFGVVSEPSSQAFGQSWKPRTNSIASLPEQQQEQQSRQPSVDSQYHQGQRGQNGGVPETTPFLQGFNLLAEAAKRAEMAVLMRDLGDFEM